jgi:hypothetical protein
MALCEVLHASLRLVHISSKGLPQSIDIVTGKLVALLMKCSDAIPNLRKLEVDWLLVEPFRELLETCYKKRGVRLRVFNSRLSGGPLDISRDLVKGLPHKTATA